MDVTSEHLDLLLPNDPYYIGDFTAEPGEELAKRVDNFGLPVGKGAFTSSEQFFSRCRWHLKAIW